VVATSATVLPGSTCEHGLPPIGYPISGTEVFILDDQMCQVPSGEAGEIYIGGAGVARGYRNQPDLTKQRFVQNPFGEQVGQRLYKTGDRGAYLPDGQIRFLGRVDDQVKIRGYRIELDEVASVLDRHPMVGGSAVVALERPSGDKYLVAYVVPRSSGEITEKELRDYLLLTLPEYMLPAMFCRLDVLPLASSGKIDRKALPPPTEANMLGDVEKYEAPRSAVEAGIASILAEILKLGKIGVHDDFLQLGGNSLLGAQVIARVRDAFHVELRLISVFKHPTIAELAAEVERLSAARAQAAD
jgi:acyl-CoA synthetase (AMP-forming)/AMP-acid ligase II/acyl carrier protein